MKEFIYIAFAGDEKIVDFFDPSLPIAGPGEAADRVYDKLLANYPEANLQPLYHDGQAIGYFAWLPGLLISFGINIHYRKKKVLTEVWDKIAKTVGKDFSCVLYTRNTRAIAWLRRCGMQVLGENVTILIQTKKISVCPQEDYSV